MWRNPIFTWLVIDGRSIAAQKATGIQ